MFDQFETEYSFDKSLSKKSTKQFALQNIDSRLEVYFLRFQGSSFNNGLYRVMTTDTIDLARSFVIQAFPDFASRVKEFAYDWLGRIFAIDPNRRFNGAPAVVMFEPGTGQALEVPCDLVAFHEDELINHSEEALAVRFYAQWITGGNPAPSRTQCVGYQRPLFLGGLDVLDNLELSDLDVYWTLSGQLIRKVKNMPPGTRINHIE